MVRLALFIVFLWLVPTVYSQTELTASDCQSVFREGNVLTYENSAYTGTTIKIKNGFHNEYMKKSKVKLRSTITWLSDCIVVLKLISVKGKGRTNYRIGQSLTIKFYKIFENKFYYKVKSASGKYGSPGVLVVQK